MPMKNPSHPGRLVKAELDELGIGIAQAANALGVTRQQLYRLVREENGVSPEMAVRLEKAIGGSAEMWLRMQAGHDLAKARFDIEKLGIKKLEPKAA